MSKETAFLGAGTPFGDYWTKRRYFDYLIGKDNFQLTFGKSFRLMVYMDNAVANGPYYARQNPEADTRATNYLISHLADIKPEFTIFITTCDMLEDKADENSPIIEQSEDSYVQNRINLYTALNRQYGRVLNVHLPSIAIANEAFCPLLHSCVNPPKGKAKLPFAPLEYHQLYLPERLMSDVEKCIPMGLPSLIPAMPPLTAQEIIEALRPELLDRLPMPKPSDPKGSQRTSIHSFQWLDPKDGYLLTKEDQIELLQFYFGG